MHKLAKKLAFGGALFFSISAFAAPSPYHRTSQEIKAILDSEEVVRMLGSSRSISSIVRNGNNYTVVAADCMLTVQITYVSLPQPRFGSELMELRIGQVNCLPRN